MIYLKNRLSVLTVCSTLFSIGIHLPHRLWSHHPLALSGSSQSTAVAFLIMRSPSLKNKSVAFQSMR
jgi:hypothetical protein